MRCFTFYVTYPCEFNYAYTIGIVADSIPIMDSQLENFRKAIETSPCYMVEQFVLLHSNYLDEASQGDPSDAYEKYKGKIAAIQALCNAALEHKAEPARGGKQPPKTAQPTRMAMRHRKTKKKRSQIR